MEDLLHRYFSGLLSDDEKDILFAEMKEDAELRERFIEIQNTYSLAQMLKNTGDEEYAKKSFQQLKQMRRGAKIRQLSTRLARYAAVVLLAAGLFFLFKEYLFNTGIKVQYTEYRAPFGTRKEVLLSDGTKVWLAPASKIRTPVKFSGNTRSVELDGEALFDVTSNKEQPFIVTTGKFKVEVLGTIFVVNAYSRDNSFKTSLQEGAVKVYNENEEMTLKPGESSVLSGNKLIKGKTSLNEIHYLQSGIYKFQDMPLSGIVGTMSNWYGVNFIIKDPKLAKSLLTGKIRENDKVETILTAVQKIYPFKYRRTTDNQIEIY
ncbi:FecR domain-containing protein [Arcticibacter tournemirensis]